MVTEYFSKIVSTGKFRFLLQSLSTPLSGIQEQLIALRNLAPEIQHGENACFLPKASRKMGNRKPGSVPGQLFQSPAHMRSRYPSAVSLTPNKKICLLPLPDAVTPAEREQKTDTKTHRIIGPTVTDFQVFDASAVQSRMARLSCIRKKTSLFFQQSFWPHRTMHFHENENTEKSWFLRIPDSR